MTSIATIAPTDERATVRARLEAEYGKPLRDILADALNDRKRNPRGSVRGAAKVLNASPTAINYWVIRYSFEPHTWWTSRVS